MMIVFLECLSTRNMLNSAEQVQTQKYKIHAYKTSKTACTHLHDFGLQLCSFSYGKHLLLLCKYIQDLLVKVKLSLGPVSAARGLVPLEDDVSELCHVGLQLLYPWHQVLQHSKVYVSVLQSCWHCWQYAAGHSMQNVNSLILLYEMI